MFDYIEFINQDGSGGFLVPASVAEEIAPLLEAMGYTKS